MSYQWLIRSFFYWKESDIMRGFTFKSLKSLKAPGLDGFDISLLNLHPARKWEWAGLGVSRTEGSREEQSWELEGARFNPAGQNTGVGSLSLLQGIFPSQGSNPGLPHGRQTLYQLSHKGSPMKTETLPTAGHEKVAFPFVIANSPACAPAHSASAPFYSQVRKAWRGMEFVMDGLD